MNIQKQNLAKINGIECSSLSAMVYIYNQEGKKKQKKVIFIIIK